MDVRSGTGSLLLIVAAALLATGCAGSPASTVSVTPVPTAAVAPAPAVTATPAPTEAPSPTPAADVSKLFTAQLADPQFEGAGQISGTMTVGNLEGTLAGAMQMKGKDSALEMSINIPDVLNSNTATIRFDGDKYTSTDGGPWFQADAKETGSGLAGAIGAAAVTARDDGVVTRQGQQLHHMVLGNASTITAADLGIIDPSMVNATPTLEFYARDDGSLAVMSVRLDWTVDNDGTPVPVVMTMDFTFDQDPTVSIAPPDHLWTRFTSKQHGYSIGYPADFTLVEATSDEDVDIFALSSTEFGFGMRERQPKVASDKLDAYVRAFLEATPWEPDISEGTQAAGEDAWRVAYYAPVNDEELYFVFTLLIEGRNGYQVGAVGPRGYEADIVDFHETQLTTLTIPGR